MDTYTIGDWVKLEGEEDSFHILDVDDSGGFIKLEDVTGHTFAVDQRAVTKKLTKEEIYGFENKQNEGL